jgi:hypothetical protein
VRTLQRWLALSPEQYAAMAAQTVQTFNARFHIEQAARRLLEIVREGALP